MAHSKKESCTPTHYSNTLLLTVNPTRSGMLAVCRAEMVMGRIPVTTRTYVPVVAGIC